MSGHNRCLVKLAEKGHGGQRGQYALTDMAPSEDSCVGLHAGFEKRKCMLPKESFDHSRIVKPFIKASLTMLNDTCDSLSKRPSAKSINHKSNSTTAG